MKTVFGFLLVLLAACELSACGGGGGSSSTTTTTSTSTATGVKTPASVAVVTAK
jgi:hypothetical protein